MLSNSDLQRAIREYIDVYSVEANHSDTTRRNKRQMFSMLLKYLNSRGYDLQACKDFLNDLRQKNWKPNSILDLVKMLRAFTNYLHKYKYLPENFASDIIKPKVPQKPFDYVDPEVVESIIIAGTEAGPGDNARNRKIKEDVRFGLRFMLRTGVRINELLQIKGSDINIYADPPEFRVNSKGGNIDVLPLPIDLIPELKERLTWAEVFPITEKTCNTSLARGIKKLHIKNIRLSNHSLRRIFATNLAKKGVPALFLQKLMRHTTIETTMKHYIQLDKKDLSQALNNNQSVIRKGLTTDQLFDMAEKAIKATHIQEDPRLGIESLLKSSDEHELM